RFAEQERIAFVQANHDANPEQPSTFARDLASGIGFHWDVYQPIRNTYGFVCFYGHGGLIRRAAWEDAGGFPEVVSEDLAFRARLRARGWWGRFAHDVTCYEDFPA